MSNTGLASEILGRIAYEFTLLQPFLPTYLHLLISALFPIFTGAHASLSRPSSAAEPTKDGQEIEADEDEDGVHKEQKMEGLSPSDAIMFPILAGSTLAALYFLIKWLEDPVLLNKILNWYFSLFGILSLAKLLTDSMGTITSFAFPSRYSDKGTVWKVRRKQRLVVAEAVTDSEICIRESPLPGFLGRARIPSFLQKVLWALREVPSRKVIIRTYIRSVVEANLPIGPQGFLGSLAATSAVAYFNFVDKPWWLTNLLGFGFSYSALQLMSPTTFWTGTLILSSLFCYDIYFVFFTPLMVTVAQNLDIPIKLLFPRPAAPDADPGKQAFSMLGLGDVVLPGIMIGLALRFDLYLFYLRKQAKRDQPTGSVTAKDQTDIVKAQWFQVTGHWGERFWIGVRQIVDENNGGAFPKTYFYVSMTGYLLGMICTLGVMQIFGHAQPALLYLVPGVLGSLWGTAFIKGDQKLMWSYTEASEEEKEKEREKGNREGQAKKSEEEEKAPDIVSNATLSRGEKPFINGNVIESQASSKVKNNSITRDQNSEIVLFSIKAPPLFGCSSGINESNDQKLKTGPKQDKIPSKITNNIESGATLEEERQQASQGDFGVESLSSSSQSSEEASPSRKRYELRNRKDEEPALKRQRYE